MNIIAVDDEDFALSELKEAISEALPKENLICFLSAKDALHHVKQAPVDVAFLDIKMSEMDGLTLACKISGIQPGANIIFVTGYSEYLEEAFEQYASGYVKKPVRGKRVLREIENLRHPLHGDTALKKVKTLGPYMFDHTTGRVYCNGRDTVLKPKEYQLFCVFAGSPGLCFTPEELYQKVWGDDPNDSVHTVTVHISSIRKKLEMDRQNHPNIKKERSKGYYLETEV